MAVRCQTALASEWKPGFITGRLSHGNWRVHDLRLV